MSPTVYNIPAPSSPSPPRNPLRQQRNRTNTPRQRPRTRRKPVVDIPANLLESLTRSLTSGEYECMVCYSEVRPANATWSCDVCYAVYHLGCVEKWARKCLSETTAPAGGWRCPGCQNVQVSIPSEYRCFCSKEIRPAYDRYNTPHTCGNVCGKPREAPCPHACTLACHPGPCPPCTALAPPTTCFCGNITSRVRCAESDGTQGRSCGQACGELLGCGLHHCQEPCHDQICPPCMEMEFQKCFCASDEKVSPCSSGTLVQISYRKQVDESGEVTGVETLDTKEGCEFGSYACDRKCGRLLACSVHRCSKKCHVQDAEPGLCSLDPSLIKTCPCGKLPVESILGKPRLRCSDPIPLCGKICGKVHRDCEHACRMKCHDGPCAPCQENVSRRCRCGATEIDGLCFEWTERDGKDEMLHPPTCETICKSLRNCRKHQCGIRCCPSPAHKISKNDKPVIDALQADDDPDTCKLLCGKKLQCGVHTCTNLCHRGHCNPCLEASFEELVCNCGRTRLNTFPIPCGATLPPCPYRCTRSSPCGHASLTSHNCHGDGEECPPCVYLVSKKCVCGKSVVRNIPCHRTAVSCGTVCGKRLSCGGHVCQRVCHTGDCLPEKDGIPGKCSQTCGKIRRSCPHACTAECHAPAACPEDRFCNERVVLSCPCGNLTQQTVCGSSTKKLSCNDFCLVADRNKRFAEALGLERATGAETLSEKAAPEYEDSLLRHAASNLAWVRGIEQILADFVTDIDSNPTSIGSELLTGRRTVINFPPMKSPNRAFIHELCAHYGLTSESRDEEPYRSVVVRKGRLGTASAPSVLASTMATRKRTTSAAAPAAPVAIEQTVRSKPRPAVNCLRLVGLKFGTTSDDLDADLASAFGRLRYSIRWSSSTTHDNFEEVLVLPVESSLPQDEIESALSKAHRILKAKLPAAGLAHTVECAWLNSKGEVLAPPANTRKSPPKNSLGSSKVLASANPYAALSTDSTSGAWMPSNSSLPSISSAEHPKSMASKDLDFVATKPSSPESLPALIYVEEAAVPDDWEELLDVDNVNTP